MHNEQGLKKALATGCRTIPDGYVGRFGKAAEVGQKLVVENKGICRVNPVSSVPANGRVLSLKVPFIVNKSKNKSRILTNRLKS